jgi:hypothetical protein
MTRTCSKCKTERDISFFCARKDRNSYMSHCKICSAAYRNQYRSKEDNKEKERASSRRWREKNAEYNEKRLGVWRENNREKINTTSSLWRSNNRERVILFRQRYKKKTYATPKGYLSYSIRGGINKSLKNGSKNRERWTQLVGYSVEELKRHIEKQFTDGMSWDNHGKWHIDHIIPISAFNYETPLDIDFGRCWALSNLRPLWAKENIRKNDRLDTPFQPSLNIAAMR